MAGGLLAAFSVTCRGQPERLRNQMGEVARDATKYHQRKRDRFLGVKNNLMVSHQDPEDPAHVYSCPGKWNHCP